MTNNSNAKSEQSSQQFYIETVPDGRVLRCGDVGITFGGSDPSKYSTEQLAKKVADSVMGIIAAHGRDIKLVVKRYDK